MELLYKRQQTSARFLKVAFKLWGKIELSEEEAALVKRYNIADGMMVEAIQPNHIRNSVLVGLLGGLAVYIVLGFLPDWLTNLLALAGVVGSGYWFFHRTRQTIYVKDLLHGRHFVCRSVADLARMEAWLEDQALVFRSVMEAAKQWDGTETIPIPVVEKEVAKEIIRRHAD